MAKLSVGPRGFICAKLGIAVTCRSLVCLPRRRGGSDQTMSLSIACACKNRAGAGAVRFEGSKIKSQFRIIHGRICVFGVGIARAPTKNNLGASIRACITS